MRVTSACWSPLGQARGRPGGRGHALEQRPQRRPGRLQAVENSGAEEHRGCQPDVPVERAGRGGVEQALERDAGARGERADLLGRAALIDAPSSGRPATTVSSRARHSRPRPSLRVAVGPPSRVATRRGTGRSVATCAMWARLAFSMSSTPSCSAGLETLSTRSPLTRTLWSRSLGNGFRSRTSSAHDLASRSMIWSRARTGGEHCSTSPAPRGAASSGVTTPGCQVGPEGRNVAALARRRTTGSHRHLGSTDAVVVVAAQLAGRRRSVGHRHRRLPRCGRGGSGHRLAQPDAAAPRPRGRRGLVARRTARPTHASSTR